MWRCTRLSILHVCEKSRMRWPSASSRGSSDAMKLLSGRFHPQLRDTNGRAIGTSQPQWTT
jgi:hypothetical protein